MSTVGFIPYDDVPLRRFHIRISAAGAFGQLSDGYILGIVGIAASVATPALHLNPFWQGLIGAGSLAGLFFGSLLGGSVVGRIGRRGIFAWDMLVFALLSLLQFFVSDALQLLVIRVILGIILGMDYVTVKTFIAEFVPRRSRGSLMSVLALMWAIGYVGAYLVGYAMRGISPDIWRLMLASSAIPAFVGFIARIGVPESPRWLMERGRVKEAEAIVRRHLGPDVSLPEQSTTRTALSAAQIYRALFSVQWRRRTWVGMAFYACHILPYFCLSTFAPKVMSALKVGDGYTAGLIYNALILLGAVLGMIVIDRISRRGFLVTSFVVQALLLAPLVLLTDLSPFIVVALFGLFGCLLSAADNLGFCYPAELFPTELRPAGIGLAVASSRLAAAVSTFFLPVIVSQLGAKSALGICCLVSLAGGIICYLWAPETGGLKLATASADRGDSALGSFTTTDATRSEY
jgi:putative MFS transporter